MSYDPSLCKCPGCPWHNTNSCLYEQAEAQVKDLLKERKIFKEALASRQNTNESPGTASNIGYKFADAHAAIVSANEVPGFCMCEDEMKYFRYGFEAARRISE